MTVYNLFELDNDNGGYISTFVGTFSSKEKMIEYIRSNYYFTSFGYIASDNRHVTCDKLEYTSSEIDSSNLECETNDCTSYVRALY